MSVSKLVWRLRMLCDPEGIHQVVLARAVHNLFMQWPDRKFESGLDYGCGGRPYQKELERVCGKHVGVDIGSNACADLLVNAGATLPQADGSVDLVTSFQVLEHVDDYQRYLRECARVCKKGGVLVLSAPSVWPFHPHPEDFRRWMLPGLKYDLKQAGFEVTGSWPILNPVSTAMQYFLSVCRYKLRAGGFVADLVMTLLALWFNPQILFSEKCFKSSLSVGAGNYLVVATRV